MAHSVDNESWFQMSYCKSLYLIGNVIRISCMQFDFKSKSTIVRNFINSYPIRKFDGSFCR